MTPSTDKTIQYRLYTLPETNDNFVVTARNHVFVPDKDGWDSKSNVMINSMMWAMGIGVKVSKENDGWYNVASGEQFEFVKMDLYSPAFAHGGTTVLIVSGPTFDEAKILTEKEKSDAGQNKEDTTTI